MNYKPKIIAVALSLFFTVGLFAQVDRTSEKNTEKNKEKSTIVMTQSELTSLLNSIAEARRAQLRSRKEQDQQGALNELRVKYQELPGSGFRQRPQRTEVNVSDQEILRELQYLHQRIDDLVNSSRPTSTNRDNATIVVPGNSAPSLYQPYSGQGSTKTVIPANNDANDDKIKMLEARLDSLRNASASQPERNMDNSLSDSLNTMKGNLSDVRRQLDSLESKMNAANKPESRKNDAEATYFKQEVFFENNSETLQGQYYPKVQRLTEILMQYPEAKVLLEGWASPTGSASYNKELSMRRAEAVEQAFLNNRIDKTRILTSFRGEDKTSSAEYARRVDMSIIVR